VGKAVLLRLQNETLLLLHGHQVGFAGCGRFSGDFGALYYYKIDYN
jgi:hypothetical protein